MNKMQNTKSDYRLWVTDQGSRITDLTRSWRGITLIEMLVILSIIVIMVAIAAVEFIRMDDRAVRERALVAAKGLATGLKLYYSDNGGRYPLTNLISSLAPYTNITHLREYFEPNPAGGAAGGVSAPPLQGIQIYYQGNVNSWPGSGEVCIYGAVRTLSEAGGGARYFVMHCVDANESNAWSKALDQPTCFNSQGAGVWQACVRGL